MPIRGHRALQRIIFAGIYGGEGLANPDKSFGTPVCDFRVVSQVAFPRSTHAVTVRQSYRQQDLDKEALRIL